MKGLLFVIVTIASTSSYQGNFGFKPYRHHGYHPWLKSGDLTSVNSGEDSASISDDGYLPPQMQDPSERWSYGHSKPPHHDYGHHKPPHQDGYGNNKPHYDHPHHDHPPHYHPSWNRPPNKPYPGYEPTPSPTQSSGSSYDIQDCEASCPGGGTDPVCGTNRKTYQSIEQLECARKCGVDVQLGSPSACVTEDPAIANVIASCISTCSVTSEYNPVCGTDEVTYTNFGRFECAKNCGRDIEISRMSSCSVPPGPNNPDLRVTTEKPKDNGNSNNNGGDNTGEYNKDNPGSKDNKGDNNISNNKENCKNYDKTPSMAEVLACMQKCPITAEVNAVCGTDGVTYRNPGKMLCAQFCGVDVKVSKFSTCSGEELPSPQPACPCPCNTTPDDRPPTTEECVRRCPVSQELKPVCGSDGVTYLNLESLQCKMRCGVDVSVQKLSACGEASTNPPTEQTNTDKATEAPVTEPTPSNNMLACIDKCPATQKYKPVCGTNGQTYGSLERLQCARGCGVDVDMKNIGACDGKGPDSGITISHELLVSIFPEDFKPTSPKGPDDEDVDLDQRYGDNKS